METKKILYTLISILFLTSISTALYSQGCEDSGGDEDGVKLKGFIQPQFNYNLNGLDANGESLDESTFTFNRARLGVLGSIPYDIKYYFFTEISPFKSPSGAVEILDAFVTYDRFGVYAKLSMGQFKAPISLEQNTSCSGLYTVNRSTVVAQLAGPQRDLGLMVTGGNDTTLVKYALAYMNGAGKGIVDDNMGKDILGRLVFQPLDEKMLAVGGSFRTGKRIPTDLANEDNDVKRFAGELRFEYKGFVLQGEYIHGIDELYSSAKTPIYGGCGGIVGFVTREAGTYTTSGHWIMASYKTQWNLEPVVKYDYYDPDMDIAGDWSNNITIGLNYFFNDWTRLQINYVITTEPTPVDNDMIMFQTQVKF